MGSVAPLTDDADLVELVARMREPDRREIAAIYGADPLEALRRSAAAAEQALVGRGDDGDLMCIWGVRRRGPLSWRGHPWMICTDAVERRPREFLRGTRFWVGRVQQHFDELTNVVHDENVDTIRWLRWLGFQFGDPVELRGGARALPFAWWSASTAPPAFIRTETDHVS